MRKAFLLICILSILAVGCKDGDQTADIVESPSSAPSATPSAAPSSMVVSVSGAAVPETISFTEQAADTTFDQTDQLIRDYQRKLIEAINTNTFESVEPYLLPESSLYNAQKELVANLYSRNIKERFESAETYYSYIEKDHLRVEVMEKVEVIMPGHGGRINEYHWYYTIVNNDGKLLLSSLEEWTTYEEEMEQRGGSVKGDGYYAGDLVSALPKILEQAVNTLDITEIKRISANEAVLGKLKKEITELRRQGTGFTLHASFLNENWDTLEFTQELKYEFTDAQGKTQHGSKTFIYQIDEIRSAFSGYAELAYLADADGKAPPSDPLSVVSHHIRRIDSSKPEYLFTIHGRADSTKHWSPFNTEKVEIYDAAENGRLLQEIQLKDARTGNGRSLGAVFEDMNFDGHLDFRIQAGIPASPNIPYSYWLWDELSASFLPDTRLEEITSPVFDPIARTIQSHAREGGGTYSDNTYTYRDGEPMLIRRVERQLDNENHVWHITIKNLVDQQMKVTGQYNEPIE